MYLVVVVVLIVAIDNSEQEQQQQQPARTYQPILSTFSPRVATTVLLHIVIVILIFPRALQWCIIFPRAPKQPPRVPKHVQLVVVPFLLSCLISNHARER